MIEPLPAYYVPCSADEDGRLRVTLRRTRDGRIALLVYSALDRLRAGAGDVPWALISVPELQKVKQESPFDVIYQDLRIPDEYREVAG